MNKKTIAFLVVVSLLALPVAASAATEFTLGGYLKLHVFWDSAAMNKNNVSVPLRNNHPDGQHGRLNFTSQSSRFNFTIKGPELWGAKTTGYLEVDFDQNLEGVQSASHAYTPRLRHAFFRFNWPETELLMGQYWDFFCEYYPESIQDGPFQGHGQATHRLAQVRLSQDFGLGWAKDDKLTLAGLIGKATDTNDDILFPAYPISNGRLEGQTSETPQIQGKIRYDGDLWGKAGFYGRPMPFSAQVAAAWQRTRYRAGEFVVDPTDVVLATDQKYRNNWAVQGTLFIPIIPTATANLAGTSALTVQGYVGQGLDFIGNDINNSFLSLVGVDAAGNIYLRRNLQRVYGGYASLNYYFTNEWFANVLWGGASNYGVNGFDSAANDLVKSWWEINANVYYRPVTAVKFGLGYAYSRAKYYHDGGFVGTSTLEDTGDAHRVQFAGWFFF
ncbi:MAG: hypothetical protein QME75_09430 [Deltaproteobacteria bacterium]|nr:hypothetical protein [Deltaproteobacteria bacterium]